MKIRFVLTVIALCLSTTVTLAAPIEQDKLTARVSKLILEHYPDAEIIQGNGKLIAKHDTMIFTIHRHLKTGEILEKMDQVEGPNFKGFILSISTENGKYVGQAKVPQTIGKRYWETYIDRPLTDDGKGHYVINFSYGFSLDRKFMKALFEVLPRTRMPTKE